MKRIVVLGSTGSIGRQTLDIVRAFPDEFEVVGLAAGNNIELLKEQVKEFSPKHVCCIDPPAQAFSGMEFTSMEDMVCLEDVDQVMVALMGSVGLVPTLNALKAGKSVALSNKEPIVMAGGLIKEYESRYGGEVLPVDSEPSAIWQCLQGEDNEIRRLLITASGGPFRETPIGEFAGITVEQALKHPSWVMGRKITIDSATMFNKGLEMIEARWLFGVPADRIDVVVHPQSVVHSLVELRDGSQIAQLGVTDMRLPIQYAFSYPDRWDTGLPPLDLAACGRLEFGRPDTERFPCLALAYRALGGGPALPVALNAANEVAVQAFLDAAVPFTAIPVVIAAALDDADADASGLDTPTLADVRRVDARARAFSRTRVGELQSQG